MEKKRIDLILVERNLAKSRTHAQDLIKNQSIFVQIHNEKKLVLKANQLFESAIEITVHESELNKYVSRAGLKIESAIQFLHKDVSGLKVLDVGTSTGGFVDYLLQNQVAEIIGLDVGHGQLAPKLMNHSQFVMYEGINARYLRTQHQEVFNLLQLKKIDLITMDVSFISVFYIFPELVDLMTENTFLLSLIKPQFEVGPQFLNKNGIVSDKEQYLVIEEKIKQNLELLGLTVLNYFPCPIIGKDGNQEFFVYAKK